MSEAEKVETQEVGLQFSLYPLRQPHLRPAIEAAVQAAAKEGVAVTVGRLGTFASGSEEAVFAAIRAAFTTASSYGPTVMIFTVSSGLPSEETVAGIQTAAHADPTRLKGV
jgi:uncharacterized protein YqgV (UPF0045/DUF77 family)